ncbi:MAG: PhzF family phenazine biosynthesis protein [Mycobacterium leprae]
MQTLHYMWLDVFADRPLTGNALCVFLDGDGLTGEQMQALARETNLSETTFVLPPTQPGATYRNRIFTPGGELAFAGHPTLGTAAAVAISRGEPVTEMVQETKSGLTPLDVAYVDGKVDRVVMVAPSPTFVAAPDPEQVARTLGLHAADVTPAGLRPEVIASGVQHLVIPVASPAVLSAVRVDTAALLDLSRSLGVIGAYPFALLPEGGKAQARARLFAPLFGITEDAATGSAAAPFGAYLHRHGLLPQHASSFWYEQGEEMGRPSRLWVEVTEQASGLQVEVGGQVRILGRGELAI